MIPFKDDQPRYSTPYVNNFLIGINLLIFASEFFVLGRSVIDEYSLIPARVWAVAPWTSHFDPVQFVLPFFTSMFLHAGWEHVLGNMLFLYIFGDNVEDYLGHFPYLIFYLLSGLFAAFAQVSIYSHSHIGMVGASGAIAGVLGAYFILYPRARVLTWFFVFVVWVPAWIILGYWFVLQFLMGASTLPIVRMGRDVGGVAVWAHVGGFLAGMLLIKIFPARARRSPYGRY
jgi:membrane associated rhomboid family serine protease